MEIESVIDRNTRVNEKRLDNMGSLLFASRRSDAKHRWEIRFGGMCVCVFGFVVRARRALMGLMVSLIRFRRKSLWDRSV